MGRSETSVKGLVYATGKLDGRVLYTQKVALLNLWEKRGGKKNGKS